MRAQDAGLSQRLPGLQWLEAGIGRTQKTDSPDKAYAGIERGHEKDTTKADEMEMKMSCDKEAVIDRIHDAIDSGIHISLFMDVLELLEGQPQIVRCRDCKYLEHMYTLDELNGKRCYVCRKHTFTGLREEDWFCADGERR